MVTKHSINLKYTHDPCFALFKRGNSCRLLTSMHEKCGTYKCPFYKPEDCTDWIRIEDNTGVNLIPPEDLGGK